MDLIKDLTNFKISGKVVKVCKGTLLYTAVVVDVASKRVLINRISESEMCCGGRKKKYREILNTDSISNIQDNVIYILE